MLIALFSGQPQPVVMPSASSVGECGSDGRGAAATAAAADGGDGGGSERRLWQAAEARE